MWKTIPVELFGTEIGIRDSSDPGIHFVPSFSTVNDPRAVSLHSSVAARRRVKVYGEKSKGNPLQKIHY